MKTPYTIKRSTLAAMLVFMAGVLMSERALSEDIYFVNENWPPYIIVDDAGNMDGIDIEILTALTQRMGLTLKTGFCPWSRCLKAIEDGHADIISAALKRADREKYMFYIEPPYIEKSVKLFYLRKGESTQIRTYEDLSGLSIGVLRGSAYFPQFDTDQSVRKVSAKTTEQLLEMLKQHRIDTFIGTELVTDYIISSMHDEDQFEKSMYRYESTEPFYFALSKRSPLAGRLNEFNATMQQLSDDGSLAAIIDKKW